MRGFELTDPAEALGRLSPTLFRLTNDARLALGSRFRAGALAHGPRDRKRVALTFDDGPDPRWTPAIVEALGRAGARATFFLLGEALERHPEVARVVAAQHEVGTHSYSHGRHLASNGQAMLDDLDRALRAHDEVLGERPVPMRFPFGRAGVVRASEVRRKGLVPYHWTFSSLDSRRPAERIIARFAALVAPGDIVLLHDGIGPGSRLGPGHRDHTVVALPTLLEILAERGLEAVTLAELFAPAASSPSA